MGSWQNDQRLLERELTHGDYQVLLRRLRMENAFYRRFESWANVIAFMRAGSSDDPRKDQILRPIFAAHHEDNDPRWRTILLAIFWPGLRSMHWKKRNSDPDSGALWTNITWVFLEVVCQVDVTQRPNRLVQKIVNDTFHRLYELYRREWDMAKRFVTPRGDEDENSLDLLVGGEDAIEHAAFELRDEQEAEIRRLRRYVSKAVISEVDFLLIVATRIYGDSLVESAGDLNLEYPVAKKRRQRAEAKIRRQGKKL